MLDREVGAASLLVDTLIRLATTVSWQSELYTYLA